MQRTRREKKKHTPTEEVKIIDSKGPKNNDNSFDRLMSFCVHVSVCARERETESE